MRKASGALNAYVVLQSKTAAEKALELNGTEFKGMHLRVTKSSLKHSASAQESKEEAKRTIFVGNLKYTATEESLRETFSSCGEIEYVRCIREGTKGCKGVAYVRFKTADAVGLALELNQTLLDDRPINVERYSVKKLGAKEQRDAQAAKEKQNQHPKNKGDKSKKFNKSKDSKPQPNKSQGDEGKKSKKSEFRGVKVEALKKKNKQKKKKPSQAMDIAKKIAPRTKSEE
uniref:RNA recognition protein n=1 Tax=Musca domestica TaxID=7370 RepID=T1PIX2_MUSDO